MGVELLVSVSVALSVWLGATPRVFVSDGLGDGLADGLGVILPVPVSVALSV